MRWRRRSTVSAVVTLDDLLPRPDQSPRCAPFAREIGLDPGGSGLYVDLVLLVDVPLPWPKPVGTHPLLHGVMELTEGSPIRTRLLASVPPGAGHDDSNTIRVVGYRRHGGSGIRGCYAVPDHGALVELVGALASDDEATAARFVVREDDPPSSALLLCTQGSHDVCCGSEGVRLAEQLDAELSNDVELHRVSHTGGHRFAPTAMTLPDGRMWAYLERPQVAQLLERSASPDEVGRNSRGWWGAPVGFGQMAERAVFMRQGWEWSDEDRTVEVFESDDATSARCVVTAGEQAWDVEVVVARTVPTIACRAAGGLPAKPGKEYRVTSVTERR